MLCNRLDRSVKTIEQHSSEVMIPTNSESYGNPSELENFLTTSPIKVGNLCLSTSVSWEVLFSFFLFLFPVESDCCIFI